MHLSAADQAGVLLLIKQIASKYPAVRSNLVELEDDAGGDGFGNSNFLYRADVNDPSIANASSSHCLLEIVFTYNQHKEN